MGGRSEFQRFGRPAFLRTFLESSERKAKLSHRARLRIVDQALLVMRMNYVHLPMKRAIHAIDPVQRLRLLRLALEDALGTGKDEYEGLEFHREMLSIFGSTRDLHTLYLMPKPYRDYVAYLPFIVESCRESGRQVFVVTCALIQRGQTEGGRPRALFEPGVEVLRWNGLAMTNAIRNNAQNQAGSNLAARFARGLDSLTIRPLINSLPPDEDSVEVEYRALNGCVARIRQLWQVIETPPGTSNPGSSTDLKRVFIVSMKRWLADFSAGHRKTGTPSAFVQRSAERPGPIRLITRLESVQDVLEASRLTFSNEQTVGYIRLYSFEVRNRARFVETFRALLTRRDCPQHGLIVDVRGNTGGSIRAAESLLQLLTPNEIKPELFEFISTPMNREICARAPKNWNLRRWYPSIGASLKTRAQYSAGFPLTQPEDCNDIGQVYYGPVVLITDPLSYSATDMFAAGFQDNEVGVVLGTGGNTGAGGANVWSLGDLAALEFKRTTSPFRHLPGGADMTVAMRRSIRVGPNAGTPLEEFGVEPDALHDLTRRDILEKNVDLLVCAAGILRRCPVFSLRAKPYCHRDERGVAISAEFKRPASRTPLAIDHTAVRDSRIWGSPRYAPAVGEAAVSFARADVYVNDRPVKSQNAVDGNVQLKRVRVAARRDKPVRVEIRAVDRLGRCVARRRMVI